MTSTTTDRGRLRVASFNLRGLRDDMDALVEVVRAIDPDVLLVQELPRHPCSGLRVRRMARRAGLRWTGRTLRFGEAAVMTSRRVRSTRSRDHLLRFGPRENPRTWTVARVTTPEGGQATVVSVHLSLRAPRRVDHVRSVLARIAHDPDLPGAPALVVGGDLNEGSDGTAWGILANRLVEVTDDRPTFPARAPRRRIDAIFASGHRAASVPTILGVDPERVRAASDHLPIWVDLTL